MKRERVLFLKENYVLKVLKSFFLAGLFLIALLLVLVHKIDINIVSGVSRGVMFVVTPLIHVASLPAEGLGYGYKKIAEIMYIHEENERLRQENQELYLLKDRMRALQTENRIFKKLLHHIDIPQTKSYTARVIAENDNAFSNSLILYLGNAADFIKSGYAVVNASGLIGRIEIVSGKYARVTLITDINSKIPVVSLKSRDRGILVGNNTRSLNLIFPPLMAELHKGDVLVTSGAGGGLPPDIPVAKIKRAGVDTITATPLFSPSELEIVKIIAYDVLPDEATAKELE